MVKDFKKRVLVRVALMVAGVVCMAFAVIPARGVGGKEAREKARYMYAAGAIEKANGRDDAAHEYFRRAYMCDPDYAEAANAYGLDRLQLPLDTLQSDSELDRSLEMIRLYADRYPDDTYESQYYGYVATQLGHNDEAVRVLARTLKLKPSATSTLLQLSDAYAASDSIQRAVEALTRYEREEGILPQVTMRKLSYLLADKDTVGALREVTRLMASDPKSDDYALIKGNVFDIISMPDSAEYYYTLAERLDPESGNPKLALANFYSQKGDSVAYDGKIYELLQCEDLDLDMKADMLAQYLQKLINDKHDTQRGDHLFSVLQGQYPHEPRVLDLAARYSAAKTNYREAEEQISYALDLDPANTTYWGQLMTYQAADGRPEESVETFSRAKKHIVPDESLSIYFTMVAQQAKRYDLAADVFREMIDSLQPGLMIDSLLTLGDVDRNISMTNLDKLSSLLASLGDVYHLDGQNPRAYRMYENALVFNSSNAMAANNYAYFMSVDGGDLEKALALIRQALAGSESRNPTYLDTHAWINYLLGNYEEAEKIQLEAVTEMEKQVYRSPEIYDHMGDIEARLGKMPQAVAAWKQAVKLHEENEETHEPAYQELLDKIAAAGEVEEVPVPGTVPGTVSGAGDAGQ